MSLSGRARAGKPDSRIWMASLPAANIRRWARGRTATRPEGKRGRFVRIVRELTNMPAQQRSLAHEILPGVGVAVRADRWCPATLRQ
jgi:hypothetical protein